jgi:hypothetical protein
MTSKLTITLSAAGMGFAPFFLLEKQYKGPKGLLQRKLTSNLD